MTRLLGSMCEGRRVPAVTIFGWDDVLCPTTHAKIDRGKHMDQAFAVSAAKSNSKRKEASSRFLSYFDSSSRWCLGPSVVWHS